MPTGPNSQKIRPIAFLFAVILIGTVVLAWWLLSRRPVFSEMESQASLVVSAVNVQDRDTLTRLLGNSAATDTLLGDMKGGKAILGHIKVMNKDLFSFTVRNSKSSFETTVYMSRDERGSWYGNIP